MMMKIFKHNIYTNYNNNYNKQLYKNKINILQVLLFNNSNNLKDIIKWIIKKIKITIRIININIIVIKIIIINNLKNNNNSNKCYKNRKKYKRL